WETCARLLPHVFALKDAWTRHRREPRATARLLCEAGSYLRQRYQLDEAEPLCRLSLEIREAALGPDHEDVADSLYQVAWVHQRKGQRTEAIPLYNRALAIYEKTVGRDSAKYADVLDNLGVIYDDLGRH